MNNQRDLRKDLEEAQKGDGPREFVVTRYEVYKETIIRALVAEKMIEILLDENCNPDISDYSRGKYKEFIHNKALASLAAEGIKIKEEP